MKKSQIRKLDPSSRSYVLAHAKLRKKRGRKPSASYRGMHNPLKALYLAEWEEQFLVEHCSD